MGAPPFTGQGVPADVVAALPAELRRQRVARARTVRAWDWWGRNRGLVAFAAALLVLVLGMWGFLRSPDTRIERPFWKIPDAAYHTVSLFGLGGDAQHLNLQLEAARWIAPLVVGWAALAVLLALFHDQGQMLRVRLSARRHVVVAGLGSRGLTLVDRLHEAGLFVVAVERDETHPALPSCRRRAIPVVRGDARDPEILARAGCAHALHVVGCGPTDTVNLEILAACASLDRPAGDQPGTVHLLMETPELRARLRLRALAAPQAQPWRIDVASATDLAGKALAGAADGRWDPTRGPVQLLAIAGSPTARAACLHLVRAATEDGVPARLVLTGASAEGDRDALQGDAPWLADAAEVQVVPWDVGNGTEPPAALPSEVDVAVVGDPNDALALAMGATLAEHVHAPTGVLVDVADDLVISSLERTGLGLAGVVPVASTRRTLGPSFLLDTTIEAIAQARHAAYVRAQTAKGETRADNPSLVGWDDLPETLKESNRLYADGIGEAVAAIGDRLLPVEPGSVVVPRALDEATVERLAELEHERWVRDLQQQGWRRTDGAKDPDRRLHPQLVPWEDLPEEERRKDRETVRELPALLAAAGYRLENGPAAPATLTVGAR